MSRELKLVLIGIVVSFTILAGVGITVAVDNARRKTEWTAYKRPKPRPTVHPTPVQLPAVETADTKPLPVINYRAEIAWDGPYDLEVFDDPSVDITSVADKTEIEIKRTVFKNNKVRVRIMIEADGSVSRSTVLSGHPILADAAQESSLRLTFSPRRKPVERLLTYTFRLLDN